MYRMPTKLLHIFWRLSRLRSIVGARFFNVYCLCFGKTKFYIIRLIGHQKIFIRCMGKTKRDNWIEYDIARRTNQLIFKINAILAWFWLFLPAGHHVSPTYLLAMGIHMFTLICPKCQKTLKSQKSLRGLKVRCTFCKGVFNADEALAEDPPPAAISHEGNAPPFLIKKG